MIVPELMTLAKDAVPLVFLSVNRLEDDFGFDILNSLGSLTFRFFQSFQSSGIAATLLCSSFRLLVFIALMVQTVNHLHYQALSVHLLALIFQLRLLPYKYILQSSYQSFCCLLSF